MILGKVCGALHSTINHSFYDGRKILIVDRLTIDGKESGDYIIAVDTVHAGDSEIVLVIDEGNSARQIFDKENAPIRSIIVGIIDDVNIISDNK